MLPAQSLLRLPEALANVHWREGSRYVAHVAAHASADAALLFICAAISIPLMFAIFLADRFDGFGEINCD